MTFTSEFLAYLRAARGEATPSAAPDPDAQAAPAPLPIPPRPVPIPMPSPVPPVEPPPAVPPRPQARPSMSERAQMSGHCGTCRAFTPSPDERYMGICSHGRGAFEPWARHSMLPASINESSHCMTEPRPLWALRAGVRALPDTDLPREVSQ